MRNKFDAVEYLVKKYVEDGENATIPVWLDNKEEFFNKYDPTDTALSPEIYDYLDHCNNFIPFQYKIEIDVVCDNLDENFIYEIDCESPMWGFLPFYDSVSVDDRKSALVKAQNDMQTTASKNEMILEEARERAKMIIEKSIVTLGEAVGKHYKVKFVNITEPQMNTRAEGSE